MLTFSYGTNSNKATVEEYADIFQFGMTGTKKTINGIEWLIFEEKITDKSVEYSYYAKNNNKYYNITYEDMGSGNACGEALTIIENSFKFE